MGAGRDPNEKLYRLRLFVFGGFAVLLAVVVLLSVAWVSATAYNVDWVVREVDAATITCCPAVSESPTGELLMTYGTSAGLMLATEDDGAWSVSPVMESGTSEDAFSVRAAAIAVDDDGYAHIASVSYWPEIELLGLNRLIYSEMTSSGWENTVVDEDASTLEVSIAVDSNSNAHISYASDTDFPYAWNLTYATDSTGEWIIYDISSQIKGYGDYWDYSVGSSIAVDGLDRPHVACVMDLQAVYVTNLTGTPVYEVISCGNAGDPEIKPSRPAILVDAEDIVHVICLSESQEVFDGPVTTTVVHYSVDEDSGSYENTTMTTTDSEKSGAATQAVVDPDGRLRLFYVNGDGVMVVTLTDDQSVVEETAHALDRETQGRWFFGLSVVLCDDGEAVMSKPYGPVGYLTDSFTLVERLSTATEPMWPILMVAVLAAGVLSVAVVLARKEFVEEAKWHKALKE